ncbi:MAG: hypothetical protein WCI20_11055 [bacterium]
MWNDIVTALGNSKDAYQAVFAAIGCVVAILGLKTWQRQLAGKTQYDLARSLLRAVYHVRDRVEALRSPFVSAAEMYNATRDKLRDEELQQALADHDRMFRMTYVRRWERVQEAISKMEIEALEAEVLLGPKVKEKLTIFQASLSRLTAALQVYLDQRRDNLEGANKQALQETEAMVMVPLAPDGKAQDSFGETLRNQVSSVAASVRPYLEIR